MQRLGRTACGVTTGDDAFGAKEVLVDDVVVFIYLEGRYNLTVLVDSQFVERSAGHCVPSDGDGVGLDTIYHNFLLYLGHIEQRAEGGVLHHGEVLRVKGRTVGPHLELKVLVRHSCQGDLRAFGIGSRTVYDTVVSQYFNGIDRQLRHGEMQRVADTITLCTGVAHGVVVVARLGQDLSVPGVGQMVLAYGDDFFDIRSAILRYLHTIDTIAARAVVLHCKIVGARLFELLTTPDEGFALADSSLDERCIYRAGNLILREAEVQHNDGIALGRG